MVTLRVGDRDVSGRLLPSGHAPPPMSSFSSATAGRADRNRPRRIGRTNDGHSAHPITAVTFDGDVPPTDDASLRRCGFTCKARPRRGAARYVRPGIGWFPDYSITRRRRPRRAHMRATLVDDGEDLRDTDVFFAVGVPNFAFGQVESPLSARQSLAELFRALGQGAAEVFSAMANSMNITSQAATSNTGRTSGFDAMTTEGTSGESAEDFFFYSPKGTRLPEGNEPRSPCSKPREVLDLYTLDIPREAPNETPDKVWHSIRLQNPTKLPWTTAPALVIADGRPVAQETLQYTPANGETTLRLTVANSIVVDRHESEASRQRESVRRFDNTWDAVTIEGTIDLRNFKDEPVVLAITRDIEGEAIPARDHHVTRIATTPRAMNPIERLEWEIPLAQGAEKRSNTVKVSCGRGAYSPHLCQRTRLTTRPALSTRGFTHRPFPIAINILVKLVQAVRVPSLSAAWEWRGHCAGHRHCSRALLRLDRAEPSDSDRRASAPAALPAGRSARPHRRAEDQSARRTAVLFRRRAARDHARGVVRRAA